MSNLIARKRNPDGRSSFRNEEGFALVITLTLLTFLVLVLFAMTTVTRVETRMAGGKQEMEVARENAKMALNTAIGQLQRYAGPDTVVTARADINPANDENPYWTGIWEDFAGSPSLMTWLVSGNEDPDAPMHFDPSPKLDRAIDPYETPSPVAVMPPTAWPSGVNVEYVRLVGSGSTGDSPSGEDPIHGNIGAVPGGVVAPKVPIFSQSFPGVPPSTNAEHIVGHYAYWVGDQGVKASVALSEDHLDVNAYDLEPPPPSVDERVRRLRQMSPQRLWFEGDIAADAILQNYPQFDLKSDWVDGEENEYLRRVLNYSQVRTALPSLVADDLKDRYHDITHMNYGVLASTLGSGLKLDLSANAGSQGHRDFLDVSPSTLQPALGTASFDMVAAQSGDLTGGEPALIIAPVVSEFVTRYSVWQDSTGAGELQVRLEAEVELWNPYSVDLVTSPLLLHLTNLELIELDHTFNQSGAPAELDLEQSLVDFVPVLPGGTTIPAGAVIHLPVYTSPDMPALDSGGNPIIFPLTDPSDPSAPPPEIEISSSAVSLVADLWLFSGATGSPTPADIDNGEEPVGRMAPDAFDPIDPPDSGPAADDAPRFGYKLRLMDSYDDPAWLTYYDPRTIGLDNSATVPALDTDPDPLTAFQATLDTPATQLLVDNSASVGARVKIFELPLQEQINMGALQHLYYHDEPAYSLGNDWGGTGVNLDFDRYFLSTIPQSGLWSDEPGGAGTGGWSFPVPNKRIIPYRSIDDSGNELPYTSDLQSDESAEHLLLQGMFNINSTSLNAWRSVLGAMNIRRDAETNFDPDPGTSGNWIYAAGDEPLMSAVFRFPQTAHLLNSPYQDKAGIETDINLAYNQGVRELTEDQVFALAYEIVDLLRLRAQPFLSLRDFVASGTIQQAIDNIDLDQMSPENPIPWADADLNGSIPPYSPAFITQGDIVSGMASFMLARSDTFIVRAYGDSHNPATGFTEARAYCEAIVQRVPATLDPTDDPVNPGSGGSLFGRRFEIVYFRWLVPGEL